MLVAPRLSMTNVTNENSFLSANGHTAEKYSQINGKFERVAKFGCLDRSKCVIHQLAYREGRIVFAGEKSIGYVDINKNEKFEFCLNEWVTKFHLLDSLEVVVLFASNVVCLFTNLKEKCLQVKERIELKPHCNIMSATFQGNLWSEIVVCVGTINGDIYIYSPSQSTNIWQSLYGHKGAIFDIKVRSYLSFHLLYSVGDDRSLRIWAINFEKKINFPSEKGLLYRQVAEAYGHDSRVFCVESGYDTFVFTGADNQTVCIWKWNDMENKFNNKKNELNDSFEFNKQLLLLNKVCLNICSAIRSLLLADRFLIIGTDAGALVSVLLHKETSVKVQNELKLVKKILSFRCSKSASTIFLVDEHKTLYRWEKKIKRITPILNDAGMKFNMIQIFEHCLIVASNTSLYIIRKFVDEYETIKLSDVPLSMIIIDSRFGVSTSQYCLVVLVNGHCILFEVTTDIVLVKRKNESLLKKLYAFDLYPKTSVLCATFLNVSHQNLLALGTRNSLILVVSLDSLEVVQVIQKAHLGKSVSFFYQDNQQAFYSFGRDGYSRSWRFHDGCLQPFMDYPTIDSPCRSYNISNKLFIAGFFNKEFRLIDGKTNSVISNYNCGGGNRVWQLIFRSSDTAHFYFLSTGRLHCVELKMFTVNTIMTALSSATLTCMKLIIDLNYKNDMLILTGSIDGGLTCFEFNRFLNGDFGDNTLPFKVQLVSSIFDVDYIRREKIVSTDELYINVGFAVCVGGRSQLKLLSHLYQVDDMKTMKTQHEILDLNKCGKSLFQEILTKKLSEIDDCRVLTVRLRFVNDNILGIYVVCSDGTFRSLEANLLLKSLSEKCSVCIPESLSIFSKLEIYDFYFYLISTCGRLFCYEEYDNKLISAANFINVETCGLSALCVFKSINAKVRWNFIGAVSGKLHVVKHDIETKELSVFCYTNAHAATITDLSCILHSEYENIINICCISEDCYLSLFMFDCIQLKLSFGRRFSLTITDPSSISAWSKDSENILCFIAGNGFQTVLCPSNIGHK